VDARRRGQVCHDARHALVRDIGDHGASAQEVVQLRRIGCQLDDSAARDEHLEFVAGVGQRDGHAIAGDEVADARREDREQLGGVRRARQPMEQRVGRFQPLDPPLVLRRRFGCGRRG
jgi:hypothetical protein